jgi:acyl-CoA thioesterase II
VTEHVDRLLERLEVERIDKFIFIGHSPAFPPRVFGGQVLAQALNAASRTVGEEGRLAHSLHAYFLRPGNPAQQIVYEVDPIRDGRSFTTRRVVAKQDGVAIFSTAVSFHQPEAGLEHQFSAPDVPAPETLESDVEYWTRRTGKPVEEIPELRFMGPIERRPVQRRDHDQPVPQEPVAHHWFRIPGDIGDDPVRHQTLLAYMSDFALLGAALLPHPYSGHSRQLQTASLDHAIWFHRPFRVDQYLLYSIDGPSAFGSRGFSRGSFFTPRGELVASTAQESLQRLRD